MEPHLEISFLQEAEISPELKRAIDALDALAFAGDHQNDPQLKSIAWAPHEWNALGRMDGALVSQLCLLKRQIAVGTEHVWVAGIGGVATHPHWRRRGLASLLMRATQDFIRRTMDVPFGLLVCAEATRQLYEGLGWHKVADELVFIQNGAPRTLKICAMILKIRTDPFPQGLINLCGPPW